MKSYAQPLQKCWIKRVKSAGISFERAKEAKFIFNAERRIEHPNRPA
ncbi:hypothetical protein KCP76_12210 [Salmonella enterica subsp. enterica serovar Weltevreden]|nr:hypothetical protein KCP76_12210 [Salmonella enterica subsp. enterica serovar Weltevreden]